MKKSIISMALAIIVAMTVAACGNTASATSNTSTSTGASVEEAHEGTNTIIADDDSADTSEDVAVDSTDDNTDVSNDTSSDDTDVAQADATVAKTSTGKKGEEENPEPLDDPEYSNETLLEYVKCADPLFDADPAPFWVSEDEFDLDGWVRACGGFIMHYTKPEADNYEYVDPKTDDTEDVILFYGYWINTMKVQLSSNAYSNDAEYTSYINTIDQNYNRSFCHVVDHDLVRITGHDEMVLRDGLDIAITVIRRIVHSDQKCLFRGLNCTHSEQPDTRTEYHDYIQHDD